MILPRATSAAVDADSTRIVREGLDAHRASVSGVSAEEEASNLILLQSTFLGAARLFAIADELTQSLINLV
jgi:flagellar hook-associated protein FlgK